MSGLNITDDEMDKLPTRQQIPIIRKNTEDLKKMLTENRDWQTRHENEDKFHHKLQYISLGVLAAAFGLTKYFGLF